jgi:hypothetical protein
MPQAEPRQAWRRIDLRDGGRVGAAYLASRQVRHQDRSRYAWAAIDLSAPIRLREVEDEARNVVFLGEYRCDPPAWRPLRVLWYRDQAGHTPLLRETPRGPGGLQAIADQTFMDPFLDALCSP